VIDKSRFSLQAMRWFRAGENVVAKARPLIGDGFSAQDAIEIAYDLQSGSYIAAMAQPDYARDKAAWGQRVAGVLRELGVRSACEAGVGEATTLAAIAGAAGSGIAFAGFDISLSRLLFGRDYMRSRGVSARLFCADLLRIPLPDSAVDAVITNHGIEPNGGQEAPILGELLRVCARYLVLIEPDFERAGEAQRARMLQHNYVRDLPHHLQALPATVIRNEPWPFHPNPENKAALIVVEKREKRAAPAAFDFVSPVTRSPLRPLHGYLFCDQEGLLYPEPFGIPVLRDDCALVCSHAGRFGAAEKGNE
jgi:hypothetical protein